MVYLILIILGWLITQNIGVYFRKLNADELLAKANTASAAVNFRRVATLTAPLAADRPSADSVAVDFVAAGSAPGFAVAASAALLYFAAAVADSGPYSAYLYSGPASYPSSRPF